MIYALLGAYLGIGLLLGARAVRQRRSSARPVATILAWTTLWPALFVLARLVGPLGDMAEPYRLRHYASYLAAIVGLLALATVIAIVLSVDPLRTLFTVAGIGAGTCAWLRPHWFWNHPGMQGFRLLLGDRLARAFYFALGAILIWVGLYAKY